MFRPPVIVAVDPGAKCGVAIFVHGVPVFVRTIRGDLTAHAAGVLELVQRLQEEHGMAVIVVELQFAGRGKKSNPKALATLHKRRHVWEILADVYRIAVEAVYPATWQTVLGEVAGYDERGEKRDTKAKARAYCEERWPGRAKDDEQGDAMAMGHWRWRRSV
jgi:hypothetical protein